MTRRHSYEPHNGHALRHDPFNAIVGPRPIGWISTQSAEGRRNLAPYSFFNAFNYAPPIVGFASIGWKDTVRNVADTGVFGWNLVTDNVAEAMNASSIEAVTEIDEFELAGLTSFSADLIAAPLVRESCVNFECRLTQLVQLHGADNTVLNTWVALGEVVKVHIRSELIVEGVYQTAAAHPILRGGGAGDYFTITEDAKFTMRRPPRPRD